MRFVIGRGANRRTFDVLTGSKRTLNKEQRLTVEHAAEDVKNFLFRPAMLSAR